jgi:hypothetical protein
MATSIRKGIKTSRVSLHREVGEVKLESTTTSSLHCFTPGTSACEGLTGGNLDTQGRQEAEGGRQVKEG